MAVDARYRETLKFDDISLKILELSLPHLYATRIIERIKIDYTTDIGIISLLREKYYMDQSLTNVCLLYWNSRIHKRAARLESIFSQLLLNIAANAIYDVLKDMASDADKLEKFMQMRRIAEENIAAFGWDLAQAWAHVRILVEMWLARAQDRFAELNETVLSVISGGDITFPESSQGETELKVIRANIEACTRGLLIRELEKVGYRFMVPLNGVKVRAIEGGGGFGWGKPRMWNKSELTYKEGDFVLISSGYDIPVDQIPNSIKLSNGVIQCGGDISSHILLVARGMGKAWAMVPKDLLEPFCRQKILVIDGFQTLVWLFHEVPPALHHFRTERTSRMYHD